MLGLPGEEGAIFPLIETKLHASPPPFTPDQVITAIAEAYGAELGADSDDKHRVYGPYL